MFGIPKELKREEYIPIFLEGIYGGTIAGIGMMAIGAFFSPQVAATLAGVSAVSTGFVTTFALQEKAREKKAEKIIGLIKRGKLRSVKSVKSIEAIRSML